MFRTTSLTPYSIHCIIYNAYYIMHTVYYKLPTSPCSRYMAQYILQTAHTTLNTSHWTLHTTHFTLHTAFYTLHTTHCTLHTAHCTILRTGCGWELSEYWWCCCDSKTVRMSLHTVLCLYWNCTKHFKLKCFTFVVLLYISWLTVMEYFPAPSWLCDRPLEPSL